MRAIFGVVALEAGEASPSSQSPAWRRVRPPCTPSASLSRRLTGLFTVVLVWILISAYASQIAMGVGEEKSNRIVEVILASVRPVQLLVGKVSGIGVLALAQAALMVATFLGLGAAVGSSLVHGRRPGS